MVFDPTTDYIGEELHFPKEDWTFRRGFKGQREVRVDWQYRYDWASYFLYSLWPYNTGTGAPCLGVAIRPDGGQILQGPASRAQAQYQKAILTLNYTTYNVGLKNGVCVIEELDPWVQYQPLDEEQLYWDAGHTQPVNRTGASRMLVSGFTYTVTYPYATRIPSGFMTLGGQVNSDSMSSYLLGVTFPAGSLLYQPGKTRWNINLVQAVSGSNFGQTFCVTQHCSYRNVDWNKDFNTKTGAWSYVYNSSGTQIKKYPTAAFSGSI